MAKEVEGKSKLISASIAISNEAWRQFLENLGQKITVGDGVDGLIDSFGAIGVAFRDVTKAGGFDQLIDLVKGQSSQLSTIFEAIAKNLPEAFKGLDFSGLVESLEGLGAGVGDLFKSFFGEIDLTTVDGLTKALQTVINTFEKITNIVTNIIKEFKPFLGVIGDLAKELSAMDGDAQATLGGLLGFGKVVAVVGDMARPFLELGIAIALIGPAVSGVVSNFAFLGTMGTTLAGSLGQLGLAAAVGVLAFELTRLSGLDELLNDVLAPDSIFGEGATLGTVFADIVENISKSRVQ